MLASRLNKIASHLYRDDNKNELRFKIYAVTDKKHPRDSVQLNDSFTSEELEQIQVLTEKLFYTKSVREWRNIEKNLEDYPKLRNVVSTFTKKVAANKITSIPFILEEMEQLEILGI